MTVSFTNRMTVSFGNVKFERRPDGTIEVKIGSLITQISPAKWAEIVQAMTESNG